MSPITILEISLDLGLDARGVSEVSNGKMLHQDPEHNKVKVMNSMHETVKKEITVSLFCIRGVPILLALSLFVTFYDMQGIQWQNS